MVRKSTFEKFHKQKNFFFIQNILYFVSKSVKCILWQIFNEIISIKIYIGIKTTFEIFLKQNLFIFYLKDFIFNKYIRKMCKFYNELKLKIVENKDLYRNKDDFRFFFLTKSSYILI